MRIRTFDWPDYDAVVRIWRRAGLEIGASDERDALARTIERDPGLFLVAEDSGAIVGAVLAAFDGRRGWLYHLAVAPDRQRGGIGRLLVAEAEARLRARGCAKVNLHIEPRNADVARFYERMGYAEQRLVFMEKWLER